MQIHINIFFSVQSMAQCLTCWLISSLVLDAFLLFNDKYFGNRSQTYYFTFLNIVSKFHKCHYIYYVKLKIWRKNKNLPIHFVIAIQLCDGSAYNIFAQGNFAQICKILKDSIWISKTVFHFFLLNP